MESLVAITNTKTSDQCYNCGIINHKSKNCRPQKRKIVYDVMILTTKGRGA